MSTIGLVTLLFALLANPVAETKADIIREARALAAQATAYAERSSDARQMFMQDAEDGAKWTKMAHQDAHLDKDGMWASGDVAYVWVKNRQVLLASVTGGSPSGDWSSSAEYVYRKDDSLARVSGRYAAFSPVEGVVIRERIFDRQGTLIHEGVKCQTLDGRKLITGHQAVEMKGFAPAIPNYSSAGKLPYYGMLNLD